ncbi:unnamed protein product [Adineta steineri]|uniref:NACHT domain-containing protein n=1 Tax=Adineta steineri TaxID=433720 RepID=A0A814PQD0_9BILA|nr:unnamed protein product [Adineta steineri]
MEDEQLYRGRFDHVGDRKLNSVRLFVSSTFTDTTDERNGLIDRVYPRLREYCLTKYNIQFQYSDMRWGIQTTAANTHGTVDLCLKELDTCCQLSMATNCVILLSHRYGSRFAPACISSHIFQLFEKCHSLNNEEKIFLSQMYQLDENYLDKKYFLRPIDDSQQWIESDKKLQLILRKAADICYEQKLITKDEHNEFYISVTAQEIYRALKNNINQSRRIICFFRDLIDIDELDSKFHDTENESESQKLLDDIKHLLNQTIHSSDIYTYRLRWKDEHDRTKYLSQFFNDFYDAIKTQIDFHMKIFENKQENQLYNQILEHAIQCNLLVQRFFPRPDIFQQIKTYITSTTNSPCILLGESGTGKSSIMAKLVNEIPTWYSQANSVSVIIRFLGATPSSSDIRRPLISIIEQICILYHLNVPSNFDNVKEILENILLQIPKDEYLILLLDSIDQLQLVDLKNLSKWLPESFLSSNVKCIFSTIPEIEIERETIHIHTQLQTIYKNNLIEIEVKTFDENTVEQVLHSWLEQDRRCLTTIQHEWLKPKFSIRHYITPLFISLLYDQTLTWHSYDQIPDKAFLAIKNTNHAIGYLYNQLGIKHGQVLFRRSMRYIQLSGGLSELEIEDILSLDDDVLQSVFVHYLPPLGLFRLPSNLWIRIRNDMHKYLIEKDIDNVPCIYFYHRSFQYYQPMDVKQLIIDNQEKLILEKNRLSYFANQYKSTFDMNYSSKLIKKYNLSTTTIPVNRCLTEQKPLKDKNNNQYNLRRLHQLYININRYDFVHDLTIFNYDFLCTYLLCGEYQMFNLLYEFSIGAHDPNGELRFILKQFETSLNILNQYPNNLSFELIYHLFPYAKQLPELTYNLLEQCLFHCPLQLITDNERQQCLAKTLLLNITCLTIDAHRIFVLTSDDKLYLFSYHYYSFFCTGNFDITYKKKSGKEKLISFLCQYPYVCCLSSNFSMVTINCQTKQITMQTSCRKLISFIGNEIILIVSLSNDTLELWNCSTNILLSNYEFTDNFIEQCVYQKPIIEVILKQNQMISYFSIDEQLQFQTIRICNENIRNYTHHILLDSNCEFYYSFDNSKASLIIYHEMNTKEIIHNIDFHSLPLSVIYLSQSKSIAWLTSTSLLIFHPLYKENNFQPFNILSSTDSIEYDVVHDHYSSLEFEGQSWFLACINKTKIFIDIYEWRYEKDEQRHHYRQLTHIQLDIHIDQCVFTAGWFDGITLYCSDKNNIYKYNATMITYLTASKSLVLSQKIHNMPNIYLDQFLTFTDNNHYFNVLTLNANTSTFDLHLSIHSIRQYHFTTMSSHILLVSRKNILSIYSLKSFKLLWTTNEFEHRKLQIHSLQSSFILICLQTKQIFQIDTKSFVIECLTQLSIDCLLSIITSDNRLYVLSKDEKTLVEFNINNRHLTVIPFSPLNSSRIIQIHSIYNYLVFHNEDNQVYVWCKGNEPLKQLETASYLIAKHNQLVLVCTDNKTIILHDLKEKLRKIILLDDNAGQCEAIELTNNNKEYDQYLFIICSDRLLRMYRVSNGQQIVKLFIHKDLHPFIGILNDYLLLKVADRLCIIKILDKNVLAKRKSEIKCPLFEQSMWMTCHHDHCLWLNTLTS